MLEVASAPIAATHGRTHATLLNGEDRLDKGATIEVWDAVRRTLLAPGHEAHDPELLQEIGKRRTRKSRRAMSV